MDKEKLKLIVHNLELLVDSLKSEIHSDVDAYKVNYEEVAPYISDYDEVFYDGNQSGNFKNDRKDQSNLRRPLPCEPHQQHGVLSSCL